MKARILKQHNPSSMSLTKPQVLVTLLDVDGCLYPSVFKDFSADKLYKANRKLFDFLNHQTASVDYKRIIFSLGTNRQDFDLDFNNAMSNKSCSCVFLLPAFQQFFQVSNEKSKVLIDPLMMGDIFAHPEKANQGKPITPGSTYAITASNGKPEEKRNFFKAKFDRLKISLIYAHAHRAACLNNDSEITINFFDDRDDILDAISNFFVEHHDLLPKNVTLRLYQYQCEPDGIIDESQYPAIKGSGTCDEKYDKTVQLMSFLTPNAGIDKQTASEEALYKEFLKYIEKAYRLYDNEAYEEEVLIEMHSQQIFKNIAKDTFLNIKKMIRDNVASNLTKMNYPTYEDLSEIFNLMNKSPNNISPTGLKLLLKMSPLDTDEDEISDTLVYFERNNALKKNAPKMAQGFHPHFVPTSQDFTPRSNSVTPNSLYTPSVSTEQPSDATEPKTSLSTIPSISFPSTPKNDNESKSPAAEHAELKVSSFKDENSTQSKNSSTQKKDKSGFFSIFFSGLCCVDDCCPERKNTAPQKPSNDEKKSLNHSM